MDPSGFLEYNEDEMQEQVKNFMGENNNKSYREDKFMEVFNLFYEADDYERLDWFVASATKFYRGDTKDDLLNFALEVFTFVYKDVGLLEYIYSVLNPEYNDLVSFLIYRKDLNLDAGVRNLDEIFKKGALSSSVEEQLPSLYMVAAEENNIVVMKYLTALSDQPLIRESYEGMPSWVILPGKVKSHAELVSEIEPTHDVSLDWPASDCVEYILSVTREDSDLNDLRRQLEQAFIRMPANERLALTSELFNLNEQIKLTLDPDLFCVFGGCLPIPSKTLKAVSADPCRKYGGCRMMTCWENENVNPITGDPLIGNVVKKKLLHLIDWFTGVCQNPGCKNRIKFKHYALRVPIVTGGWKGCYCSFACIRTVCDDNNITQQHLIDNFESMYEGDQDIQYGILHRTW